MLHAIMAKPKSMLHVLHAGMLHIVTGMKLFVHLAIGLGSPHLAIAFRSSDVESWPLLMDPTLNHDL
jgi:hypothetical protein